MLWINKRETGGMLQPEEHFTKYRERVMKVLRIKHPDTSPPSSSSLESYTVKPSELFPVDTKEDTVTEIVGLLSRGSGLRGTHWVSLQHWILRFREASGELRLTVVDFT